jgi:hypothetical protein
VDPQIRILDADLAVSETLTEGEPVPLRTIPTALLTAVASRHTTRAVISNDISLAA